MKTFVELLVGIAMMWSALSIVLVWWLLRRRRDIEKELGVKDIRMGECTVIISELQHNLDTETRKKCEYFKAIVDIEKEKLVWRDLYWKQSREHGNAQAHLMQEREHNMLLLRRNNIRPYVDPYIARLVDAFTHEHYQPANHVSETQPVASGAIDPAATGVAPE
jgi:hypothetical protein